MSFSDVITSADEAFSREDEEILLPILRLASMKRAADPDYRPGYRGSGVGKMCEREEVFKKLLPRAWAPVSPELRDIFEVGHAIHHRWQNYKLGPAGILEGWWVCRTCGFKIEGFMPSDICPSCESLRRCGSCRARMQDGIYVQNHYCKKCKSESWEYEEYALEHRELGIVGHCDGVVLVEGTRYIWEFKTINENGFLNRIPLYPLKEHVAQVQVYMWLKGLKHAIIHYLNKNTSKQKEFHIEYNDLVRKDVVRKIKLITRHQEGNTLPDNGVCTTRYGTRAKRCPWVRECFNLKLFNAAMEEQTFAPEE